MACCAYLRKVTVEPVLFLYMFCLFMTLPILHQLAFQKICQENYGAARCRGFSGANLNKSEENLVQSKTSKWILYQSVALTLPSIATSLILGSWSDKVGRKVILLLPCAGSVLLYVNHILNVVFFSANVNYLLIGVFVSGFFGGFATVLLGVFSYISDVTDNSQRTVRVAVLESMLFMGGTCGGLIGGVLVDHSGYMAAFGLALGVNVLVVLYVGYFLSESFFPQEREESKWALVAVHTHLKASFRVMTKARPLHRRLNILVITFGIFSIIITVFGGFNDLATIYCKHSPRNFTPSLIGYFFAEVFFVRGVGVVLGIPLMSTFLKLSDLIIAMIGVSSSVIFYIVIGSTSSKWMMFVGGLIAVGSGIAPPCLRSRLSKQVESTELGTMFAFVGSLEVLETLLASVIFNSIYSYTVDWLPGFSFFLMSGILVIPFILLVWLAVVEKRSNPYMAMENDPTQVQAEGSIHAPDNSNSCYQSGYDENMGPTLS